MFISFINNISLLLALSVCHFFIVKRWKPDSIPYQISCGILFGCITVAGMMNPFVLTEGIIFDGRSFVASIAGFAGGSITAVLVVLIGGMYRVWGVGGIGVLTGVCVLVTSAGFGVLYRYIGRDKPEFSRPLYLFGFGVLVHVNMLLWMFTLPKGEAWSVISTIALPVMIFFPVCTIIFERVLREQIRSLSTKAALVKSEEKYRELVENANSIILRMDREGKITFFNEYAQRFFGYSEKEIIGRSAVGSIVPEKESTGRNLQDIIQLITENPEKYSLNENENLRKNGERVWVSWTNKVILDETDSPMEILCIGTDITERKQFENALGKSEERYRAIAEDMPVLICCFLPGGKITFANRNYCEYFSKTLEDLTGASIFSFIPEEDRETVMANINTMSVNSSTQSYEHRVIKPSGDIGWQRWTNRALFDEKGTIISYQSIGEDITGQKQYEIALEEKNQLIGDIIDSVQEGVIVYDCDLRYQLWNPFMERLSGIPASKVLGRHPLELFPFLQEAGVIERLERILAGESPETIDFPYYSTITGRSGWTSDTSSPLRNAKGEMIGIIAAVRDMTERKRLEDTLTQRVAFDRIINDVSSNLVRLNIEQLDAGMEDALASIALFTHADRAYVFLFREDNVHMDNTHEWCAEGVTSERMRLQDISFKQELPWFTECINTGENVHVPDVAALPPEARFEREHFESQHIKSLIAVPMQSGNSILGFLGFDAVTECRTWSASEQDALRRVGEMFAHLLERKTAEMKVRRSNEKYKRLVSNLTGTFLYRHDTDGIFEYVSPSITQVLGYQPEEFLTHFTTYLTGNPINQKAVENTALCLQGKVQPRYEVEIFSKNGDVHWLEVSETAVPGESGQIIAVEGVAHDITNRKRIEMELDKQRYYLQKAQEIGTIGTWELDINQNKLVWTDENYRIFGTPLGAELTYETFLECVHPGDRDYVDAQWKTALHTGTYDIEHRLLVKGEVKWVREKAELEYDGAGNCIRAVGFTQDITEQRKAKERIHLQALVLDQIEDRVTITDLKGVITYINEAGTRSLGYSRNELIGGTTEKYGEDPERGAAQKKILERTLEDGQWRGEVINFAADGSEIVMDCRTQLIHDTDGVPLALAGIATDITKRKKAEAALRKRENQLSEAMKMARAGYWDYDVDSDTFTFNDNFYQIFRTTAGEAGGYQMSSSEYARRFCHPDDAHLVAEENRAIIQTTDSNYSRQIEHRILYADGEVGHISVRFFIVKDSQGRTIKTYGVNQDITERKRAEEKERLTLERREREAEVMAAVASSGHLSQGAVPELARELTEAAARALKVERAGVWLFDKEQSELVNVDNYVFSTGEHSSGAVLLEREYRNEFDTLKESRYVDAGDPLTDPRTAGYVEGYLKPNRITALLDAVIRRGGRNLGTLCFEHVDRSHHWEEDEISFACHLADQVALAVSNREYRQMQEENSRLEEQYHQAQKMEAVGRLAGGIAHDFNNMLMVIIGHVGIAQTNVESSQPLYESLQEIKKAAERSADLTRQLLAFARKQTVSPKVLNLNDTVKGMLKMLQRLIGEDIDLAWAPGTDLWQVKMDTSQIDQILANLCVNARDAIAGVGKVTLETGNVRFDEEYCSEHTGFTMGEYVQLAVSDNGCGMDKETLAQVFDPFFTTKKQGEGTGLGLATVYGVVKQNRGFINVYSEPGQGTAFKIYLPRHTGDEEALQVKREIKPESRGSETVLFVEDEPSLQKLGTKILERLGYRVLTTSNPMHAIELADNHSGEIDLLLTDVIMPEMNGRDLADTLKAQYPNLKILFLSGYPDNVIAHHGILDKGVNFLQKPLMPETLAMKVREVLDSH